MQELLSAVGGVKENVWPKEVVLCFVFLPCLAVHVLETALGLSVLLSLPAFLIKALSV